MDVSEGQYGGGLRRGSPSLLIVEDEHVARRALAFLLGNSGFDAHAAPTAEEALRMIDKWGAPEIALVDVDLPGMSGLEFVTKLERLRSDVVTVLVSAVDGERIHSFCRAHAQVTYLRKPLDFPSLLTLIDSKIDPN